MKTSVKYLKSRLTLLAFFVLLAVHFGTEPNTVSACQECVFPTGGICVGCMIDSENGSVNCEPHQDTCSCTVSGGSCSTGGGHGPLQP